MIWLGISIIISSLLLDAGMCLAVEKYFVSPITNAITTVNLMRYFIISFKFKTAILIICLVYSPLS